ncbi:DUF262 domain-containing protein [Mycolicibacterium llatzerense]|uniref:DUF262 domain-containing protein n=1 Tax=Mycolicibacterium llatzerense TaxID=280871 RepID=UPI0021B61385|nr:DUF262 domain-containing protein [Mycolicibacterium llatzerense]
MSLVLQSSDLSLESISGMVESGAIDVKPEFQRRERWNPAQSSALIESFLLNIPVPPVYLAEEEFGKYSVIDGKQRITSISQFMTNSLALTDLDRFNEINGYRFADLPTELANSLRVRPYLRVVTLLRQSDPETKYEVFHRLNSGGDELNAQEIRNVLFRGAFNDLLIQLSKHHFLRDRLKITSTRSGSYKTMQDVEYVLRFFTVEEYWQRFSGDFRSSMNWYMRDHRDPGDDFLRKKATQFTTTIDTCEQIFGRTAFWRFDRGQWRNQILSALYDAQMVAVSTFSLREQRAMIARRDDLMEKYKALFSDERFNTAVRTGTNTPARLEYRIERTIECLSEFASRS